MNSLTPTTMNIHVEAFRAYLLGERMLSPATAKRYAEAAQSFGGYLATRDISLVKVREADVRAYLVQASGRSGRPSGAVWNIQLSGLRAYFAFLVRREVIDMNPAAPVGRQRDKAVEHVPLSLSEMVALVDTTRSKSAELYRARNVAMLQLLFQCALRVAEVAALDVSQIDLTNRVIHDVRTKGGKRLAVCFNDVVHEALSAHLVARTACKGADHAALFLSDRGKRISVRTIQAMVQRYGELADLPRRISPHHLRHASVTQLMELGTPLRVVQEIVGHSSIQTTQRYAHVGGGERRKAADALSGAYRAIERKKKRRVDDKRNSG